MSDVVFEEVVTFVVMVAIGGPVVVMTWLDGRRFDTAPTLCLGLVALGIAGLGRATARRALFPRARVLRRDSDGARAAQGLRDDELD